MFVCGGQASGSRRASFVRRELMRVIRSSDKLDAKSVSLGTSGLETLPQVFWSTVISDQCEKKCCFRGNMLTGGGMPDTFDTLVVVHSRNYELGSSGTTMTSEAVPC